MRRQNVSAFARLVGAIVSILCATLMAAGPAASQQGSSQYSMQEIVDAGHGFFGSTSGGLAKVVENAFSKYGLPNGYILGQEGSGAFLSKDVTVRQPIFGEGIFHDLGKAAAGGAEEAMPGIHDFLHGVLRRALL